MQEHSEHAAPSTCRRHDTYDAIVVGARVAGCAMAFQLAQRGWRVALIEKKRRPLGPALSVPITYPRGLKLFRELGLLPVIESLLPRLRPIHTIQLRLDTEVVLGGTLPPADGLDYSVILRRDIVDDALLDFVLQHSSPGSITFFPGCRVDGLARDDDHIVGVCLASNRATAAASSAVRELRSPLLIGADGRLSQVARLLGPHAARYDVQESPSTVCYSHCTGIDTTDLADVMFLPGNEQRVVMVSEIGEALQVVAIFLPVAQYTAFRQRPDAALRESWRDAGELADRMRQVELVGKVLGLDPRYGAGYFRPLGGPGWALAGDAGHFKDPASGQGIHDALFGVQQILAALDAVTGGSPLTWRAAQVDWPQVVARQQRMRDTALLPMYRFTYRLSELLTRRPTRFEMAVLRCVADDPDLTRRFLGISSGANTVADFNAAVPRALRQRLLRHPGDLRRLFRAPPPPTRPTPRPAMETAARSLADRRPVVPTNPRRALREQR